MRWKLITTIILMLVTINIALAAECQISGDNVSFSNLNTTRFIGCVDQNDGLANIQNLNTSTTYHLRCRESTTTGWGYRSFTTKQGGINQMEIALAMIGITFLIGGGVIYYRRKT